MRQEGSHQEGSTPTASLKCCDDSDLSKCHEKASLSPMPHVTISPRMTPLNHEPGLRDSSFVDCMIGSQDLFSSSPEPPLCTGVGEANRSFCSPASTPQELSGNKTATMIGLDSMCTNTATVLESLENAPVEDYPCRQEDCNHPPQEAGTTVHGPPAHVAVSSEVAVTTGGGVCEDRPVNTGHDSDTMHCPGQASALCSVQTCTPIPVSSSPVAKQAAMKRTGKKRTARFLYPSNHQLTHIKQHSLADSKDDPTAVVSGMSALAQSVLTAKKNSASVEEVVHVPVEKSRMLQSHCFPLAKEVHGGGGGLLVVSQVSVYGRNCHDSPSGALDKEGESALKVKKAFLVTSTNSIPPIRATHAADNNRLGSDDGHLSCCGKMESLYQDNESDVVGDPTAVEQSKVPASRCAISASHAELQMTANVAGKADRDETVGKVLLPARRRKRPSRNRWSRRKKKRKDNTEDCDKESTVCNDTAEGNELGSVDLSTKMVDDMQQTDSTVNEGKEEVQSVESGGNEAEEVVQIEALAMGCKAAIVRQVDSMEPSTGIDTNLPNQRMPPTVVANVLQQHGNTLLPPQNSSITDRPSVSRMPLPGRNGQGLRIHQAAASRRSTGSGFKAPRLATSVPLAEENAARSKILRGFGVPTRPASVMTGAQHLLHGASKETHTSLKAEDSSAGQSDVEQMQGMVTHVKDSHQGLALTGFSTASGTKCTVSNSTLDRVKPLLRSEDVGVVLGMSSDSCVQADTGFSTVSDHVSSLTGNSEALVNETKDRNFHSGPMDSMFTGFSTAGGQKCTVSASALRKAEELCEDSSTNYAHDTPAMSSPSRALTGFTAASGGSSSVPASMGQHLCSETAVQVKGRTEPAYTGFSTAAGTRISVSEGAVGRVKHIFTDMMTEDGMEVHPGSISGSMVNSTEEEGKTRLNKPLTETSPDGFVDAKHKIVDNSMGMSLPGGQDVEADLQDLDMETFAACTQLSQQIGSREATDTVSVDKSNTVNLACHGQNENEESHKVTTDTTHFSLDNCRREEDEEDTVTLPIDSLERSMHETPFLDTQIVQQLLETTGISNAGSDDMADGKGLAKDGASSFNLTLSLANLGDDFSRLEEDNSGKNDDTVVTPLVSHPSIKVLEETKEAKGTESSNSQLMELEQCFSLTQFDMSLNLTDTVEGVQDSAILQHTHSQGEAIGGGAVNGGQETVREEEGERVHVIDTRGGATKESSRLTVMEEGKEVTLNIEGRMVTEEDEGVLMGEIDAGAIGLDIEAEMEKGRGTMEREWVSANEMGRRCAKDSRLAGNMPTEMEKDTFGPVTLVQPSVEHPTTGLLFPGLQTASGKEVTVSRAALEIVRCISNPTTMLPHHPSCSDECPNATESACFEECFTGDSSGASPKLGENRTMYVDLQTSSGKSVPISNEAVEDVTARRWVQGEEGTVEAEEAAADFHGLQTANGKAVSEVAVKAVQSLAHEPRTGNTSGIEQDEDCSDSHNMKPPDHFIGLQTASGKRVEVAADSLEHVRSSHGGGVSGTALHGFSTAGGKVINISERALHHVKSRLSDVLATPDFPGLQTASGTPVEVSDESLAHVRADRGALLMRRNSQSPDLEDENHRQVELAATCLQRVQTVARAGSASGVHECGQVPPALSLGSGSLSVLEKAPRAVQQEKAPHGAPPSSVKSRAQPLQPVSVCLFALYQHRHYCVCSTCISTGIQILCVHEGVCLCVWSVVS